MVKVLKIFVILFLSVFVQEPLAQNLLGAKGISFVATTNNDNPYRHESFTYNIKLISPYVIRQGNFDKLTLTDAIIEILELPKTSVEKINNQLVNVVTAKYNIVFLKSGKVTIPSLAAKLKISHNLYSNEVRDLKLLSNPIEVNVKTSNGIEPWLPATTMDISEQWSTPPLRKGEPITRTIIINAKGLYGNLLPKLGIDSIKNDDVKIYDGGTTSENNIKDGVIIGSKKQLYKIIPQKAGAMVFPEIKVAWWDVVNNKAAYVTLPSKTFEVLDGAFMVSSLGSKESQNIKQQEATSPFSSVFYKLLLAIIVLALLAITYYLSNKVSSNKEKHTPLISSPEELYSFLKHYAHVNWGACKNSPLNAIFLAASTNNSKIKKEDYENIIKSLEDSLYRGKEIDLLLVKKQCYSFLQLVKKAGKEKHVKLEKLPELNPISKARK